MTKIFFNVADIVVFRGRYYMLLEPEDSNSLIYSRWICMRLDNGKITPMYFSPYDEKVA